MTGRETLSSGGEQQQPRQGRRAALASRRAAKVIQCDTVRASPTVVAQSFFARRRPFPFPCLLPPSSLSAAPDPTDVSPSFLPFALPLRSHSIPRAHRPLATPPFCPRIPLANASSKLRGTPAGRP